MVGVRTCPGEQLLAGLDEDKPEPGFPGSEYWATDTMTLYRDSGSAWVKVFSIPYVVYTFWVTGNLSTGTNKSIVHLVTQPLRIVKAKAVVKTAPSGADILVDVNKNGTTIFTTQANRVKIADGAKKGDSGTPDVTSVTEGDELTIDIDQVGSTTAGADLTVELILSPV